MRVIEVFHAHGHKMVKATHPTTLEITKEENLTEKGDCIVAVGSTKGAVNLTEEFKKLAKNSQTRIILTLKVGNLKETIKGFGNPNLSFQHPTDLVVRKSNFTCSRTIMVKADKAAINLSRKLIQKLKNPKAKVIVKLEAEKD